tara:strand:- start:13 stop:249 length:237 start_codon:yes stop_codon:yes gene_type:complete
MSNKEQEMVEFKPKVGEYCYYDKRMAVSPRKPFWLVTIKNFEDDYGLVGCHYSSKTKSENNKFVTCLGIISSVAKTSL